MDEKPGSETPRAGTRSDEARQAMLAEIGRLVRTARAKRGMTRKALAGESGTSERYIAQIEAGEGNPTVLVLDAMARGLGLGLFDLLPAGPVDRLRREVVDRLRRIPAGRIDAVLRLLDQVDSGADAAARGRRIALVGLRGAGKSTLGAKLADRLGCPFIELDKVIEMEHGAPVAALFEVYGQATFRRYERECLEQVVAGYPAAVIATAGGIVADAQTFARLLDTSHVIWLRASPADHMRRVMEQGDFRPMASNREAMNDLIAILDAREAEYGRSHAQLDTSGRGVDDNVTALAAIAEGLFARA